jgi:hypothetical protein
MNAFNIKTYEKKIGQHTPMFDKNFNTTGTNVEKMRQDNGVNPDDWIVYNDESELNLPDCDPLYYKTVNGKVVEMSSSEKTARDTEVAEEQVKHEKVMNIVSLCASASDSQLESAIATLGG